MTEQMVAGNRREHSGSKPGHSIKRLSGRHVKHDQIYDEEDKRRAQICRNDQDQDVGSGHCGRNDNVFKFSRFMQTCRYKKNKQDLHEFRRLYIESQNFESELCTS